MADTIQASSTELIVPAVAPSFWEPFKYRAFVAIWTAAFVSDMGLWMQNVGASWLITKLSDSPTLIALMLTASSLPVFLLGIPAGALADIFNRRKILLVTQLWMFIIAVLLALCTWWGLMSPWLILIGTFLLAMGPALNETVWQSVVPSLIPSASLSPAITLNGLSINLARAIGPAIGGLIISYTSPLYVFILNAVCFLGTFVVVYIWKGATSSTTLQTQRLIGAMKTGVQYVRYASQLKPVLIRSFIFSLGTSALWGLLPFVIVQKLGLPASSYGIALFTIGAGAITAAAILPLLNNRLSVDQKLLGAILIIASTLIALFFISSIYILYGFLFFSGIAWLAAMSGFNVMVQTNIPQWIQARAISIYLLIFQGGMALGSVIWGNIASYFGLMYALVGGAIWLVASIVLVIPYPLAGATVKDWTPYNNWPEPFLKLEVAPSEGPVLVLIDYNVLQENIVAFTEAMKVLKYLRMRDGASQAGLFQDVSNPQVITEFLILESWSDYLQQKERFTKEDEATETAVLQWHTGANTPVIRQYINQPSPI